MLETTQTPLFHSQKGFGALPVDHLLQGGLAANLAKLTGESQPDLIILLGARTGMFLGGRSGAIIPNKGCKYIQIDIDGTEIGRQIPVDIGVIADVHQALISFNEEIEKSPFRVPPRWTQTALGLRKEPDPHESQESLIDGRAHPYFAMKELFSSLESGSIISIDGGEAGSWATDLTEIARPFLSLFSAGYIGMLGNGWGYSLGAAVADPSRQVINIQGDGSAGFHIGELDTFARHGVNVLTVVMNNHIWGMSQHGQDLVYETTTTVRPVSSLSPRTSFHTVSDGLGVPAAKVHTLDCIQPIVQKLSAVDGPALLELVISDKPIHPGTVAMVSATKDPDWIVVPYYDNIPRPFFRHTKS